MIKKWFKMCFVPLVALICVLIDQGSKSIAINSLVEYKSVPVIDKFFYWTLCYNTGGAWSMLSDATWLLVLISVIALVLIVITVVKSKNKMYIAAASVFIGGLIGNLIDRVFNHKVTDFIDFVIFGYDFPVFNIADIFICVSACFIVLAVLKEEKDDGKESD